MDIPADSWDPWLPALVAGVRDGDPAAVRPILERLWHFGFHKAAASGHDRWDELFDALATLVASPEPDLARSAYHYARIAMQSEYGPPFGAHTEADRQRNVVRRITELQPALAVRIDREPALLTDVADDLVHTEKLADLGPQPETLAWLEARGQPAPVQLAARIAYLHAREPWETARPLLWAHLDHADTLVRAYAARSIGERYLDDEDLSPPLAEVVRELTERELERPGVAGPLFNSFYTIDSDVFERRAGIDLDAWVVRILAHRKGPEPRLLPCCNGIDFFAHEIFGGRAVFIQKLLDLGHDALALEAATEVQDRIDDLEPVLMALGERADDDACRAASWHLAHHYRCVHPAGERRGFVRGFTLGGAEVILTLTGAPEDASLPAGAALYPLDTETFDEAEAWRAVDALLPPAVRGDLIAHPASVARSPGVYVLGRQAHWAYSHGAYASLRGDVEAKQWVRVHLLWRGRRGDWVVGAS